MSVLTRLRTVWGADTGVVFECRHCGWSLDPDTERCPECGSADVVSFDVE